MIKNLKEIIQNISIFDLKSYLIANNWLIKVKIKDKAFEYIYKDSLEKILLPLRKNLGDFSIRMSELLSTLSEVENRPILSIVNDINKTGFDIIRIRVINDAINGSIPFLTTNEIINSSKEMLLAAASSAQQPRKLYGSRKSDDALEYLSKVRVGQTELGSYILTFLSPIAPKLSEQLLLFENMEIDDDPFERKTTKTLLKGLNAIKDATINASLSKGMEAFENAISSGVSANLCDAIANIIAKSGGVEISLTWSKTRPNLNSNLHEKIFFDINDAEIIAEAARYFKLTEPLLNQSLTGWIYKLCQEQSDPEGTIYLKTFLNEKLKSVKVILSQHDYQKATIAHSDKKTIRLEGELVARGKISELMNPRNLIVEDHDD